VREAALPVHSNRDRKKLRQTKNTGGKTTGVTKKRGAVTPAVLPPVFFAEQTNMSRRQETSQGISTLNAGLRAPRIHPLK
jgi:hypothetical protein